MIWLCSLTAPLHVDAQVEAVPVLYKDPPCPLVLEQNAAACALSLAAGEIRTLQLTVPPAMVRRLTVEQLSGAVEVRLRETPLSSSVPSDSEPYTNKAGTHAKITILVTATPSMGREARVANPSNKPATVRIVFEPAHAASADDGKQVDAERAFAHAEVLRAGRDPSQANEASAAYDQAIGVWRTLGDQPALARALVWKAMFVAFNQGKLADGPAIIHEALGLLNYLDTAEAANCWKIAGFIDAGLANYDAATREYDSALSLFEQSGDLLDQEAVLDNKARLARQLGENENALVYASRGLAIAREIPDETRQLRMEAEIAGIYLAEGDFEQSYTYYEQALSLLATIHDAPTEGLVLSDLGVLYTKLHDFGRAKDAFDQALAYWRGGPWDPSSFAQVGTLQGYSQLLLEEGKPKEARKILLQGLDLAKSHSQAQSQIYLLRGIGSSYLDDGDLAPAEEYFEQARQSANRLGQGDELADIECSLGDLNSHRGGWTRAEDFYQQCRKAALAAKQQYQVVQAEASLARVEYKQDDLIHALQHADAAIGDIESVRGQLSEEDLRTSFFSSMHAYYDLDIAISMRLEKEHPGEGFAWKAFLISERARSRSLLDEVTAASSSSQTSTSPALLAQYDAVKRKLRILESAASNRSPQVQHSQSASIAQMTAEEHQLHQEILAGNKPGGASAPMAPLSLESLTRALPDGHSALIEYWTGTEASYAWSITRTGMHSFRLPPTSQVDPQIAALRASILATATRDPRLSAEERAAGQPAIETRRRKLAARVSATLFPPGLLPAAPSTILVVGDGSILSLPFAALSIDSQMPVQKQGVRRICFVSEPSATIFSLLEAGSVSAHPMRVAIFSDAQLPGNPDSGVRAASLHRNQPAISEAVPLPFTGNEAKAIELIFGPASTRLLTGSSVSLQGLQSFDWNQFSIGHFAMHADLNPRYAELTGLAGRSTGSARGTSDSMLWYGDICRLRMRLDMVVLSACDSALGEAVPGEGFVGLTQAFFAAGAQRVLGTLWPVDDQATSEWMRHFYLALKSTHSPAKALQRAQSEMAADPEWKAPYFWAGFVLAGDWRPLP